ncbi:MAG: ATP synthase F0 subunit B [Candidatus Pacebacteria bacterium]|jgi:F-type H+-transporting ATPase subunit b|nr:ATP synthase F0 subunit B [Candidatus Paceibacterota bacterium]MBT4651863.1 ATP synthase F0 subunit B [Candidatus Paceibacterota bacterium]MBT6755683.1 ATP synthase F0 subunit B [Candidatus Paceibacterota bacterium]MBT6921189.1 ATP synthase F0 subunit B [Candidatus Paceibacterota bacterium]
MDIQLPQIIFQLINFGVVFGALVYLLYKPTQKILDARVKRVAASLKEVDRIEAEKEKIQALKTKTKRTADKEAAVILEKAQKTANSKKQELVAKTKESLQEEMKKAQASWKQEKKQLISDSKKQMVDAVVEVSSIVLGKKIDSKTDEKLISKSLEEVLQNI